MKLSLALTLGLLLFVTQAKAASPKIMVFNFYLDNTSLQKTTAAEAARINKISDQLRSALQKSGQYEVIVPKKKNLAANQQIGKCTDDTLSIARKAGADLAACGWVQKVSNLILNINLVIEQVKTGKFVKGGSVDIRGNTDASWRRGLTFLLEEHVFSSR